MKVACTVWFGGKAGDNFKGLPIEIDNEAGKTSIVKAFSVCAKHTNARDQKDYIRDGTGGFGVAIQLEDGSLITRMKTPTLNKYEVKLPDGSIWDTAKIDSGLPVQVQELMGLVEEPETKELLQIRTYEDQLLFVTTSASANYKVMYDALKVDQLTRAIKLGSREANDLKGKISDNEVSIKTLNDNLKKVKIFDLEPLINIRNRLNTQVVVLDKLDRAKSIADKIKSARKQLGSLDLIDKNNICEINVLEVDRLVSASRFLNNKEKLMKLWQINNQALAAEDIDLTIVYKVSSIMTKRDELQGKIKSAGALVKLSELSEINEYEIQHLNRARELSTKVNTDNRLLSAIDIGGCELVQQNDFNAVNRLSQLKQVIDRNKLLDAEAIKSETYVAQVENYLKQCGAKVVNCTKCGESIVLDSDSLEVHQH